MTTKVIISSSTPNHQDILVEILSLPDAVKVSDARLTDGETKEFWLHGGQGLAVSEVAKLAITPIEGGNQGESTSQSAAESA